MKLRIQTVPWLKERITMPNNNTPCRRKGGIDKLAKDAEAQVDKVMAANPNLASDLQLVKENLSKIAGDPHHPK